MKTIRFEIIYAKNHNIHQNGYVEVPDDESEEVEWFYYNQEGFEQPREFTHHDSIGITQIGATDEQQAEIDRFLELVNVDLVDWVTDTIVISEEDENETYFKGNLIIHINDGGQFDWTDFEIWCGDVEVMGIAPVNTGKPEWYTWDGFECYDDFEKTNGVGEVAETTEQLIYLYRWCLIKDFLEKVDISKELKRQEPRIITYGAEDIRLKLYVNCSVHNRDPDNYRFDDSIGCYVKYREW